MSLLRSLNAALKSVTPLNGLYFVNVGVDLSRSSSRSITDTLVVTLSSCCLSSAQTFVRWRHVSGIESVAVPERNVCILNHLSCDRKSVSVGLARPLSSVWTTRRRRERFGRMFSGFKMIKTRYDTKTTDMAGC